jgi:pimeloyl-ACP methyl ester carboxylesterase
MQVSINGTIMAFEDHGAGPAVLLLHGFPFDRSIWKTQIQPLTLAGYRVIAPDLRGFGQSTASRRLQPRMSLAMTSSGCNYLGIGRAATVGLSWAHVRNALAALPATVGCGYGQIPSNGLMTMRKPATPIA